MKLSIGTAQFGLNYSISNQYRKLELSEIKKIMNFASQTGISLIDSAMAYGNAHKILSEFKLDEFKIYSKLQVFQNDNYVPGTIINATTKALTELNKNSIECISFHSAEYILNKNAEDYYSEMLQLKYDGLINKIGISVYSIREIDLIFKNYDFDVIQFPINVFDQTACRYDFSLLKKKKVEIHGRSIFLQGLLLIEEELLPKKLKKFDYQIKKWKLFCNERDMSPLEASIAFIKSCNFLDVVIIGIDSLSHLQECNYIFNNVSALSSFEELDCNDAGLIDPRLW